MDVEGGYPTDAALERIRTWPCEDWRGLLEHIRPYWEDDPGYGSWRRTRRRLRLATGGWSGNEDIIGALDRSCFGIIAWESTHRGGLHVYDLEHMPRERRHGR